MSGLCTLRSCFRGRHLGRSWLLRSFFLSRGENRVQSGALHSGHKLHRASVANVLDKAVNDGVSQFAVSHPAALETQRGLHLVAFVEKTHSLVLLRLIVVLVDGYGELDFLDDDDFLLFARGAIALVFLIQEFSVVLNAADGRNSIGRDFHQVEATLAGNFQSFKGGKNAELLTSFVNDAHFAGADSLIDADKLL